MFSFSLDYQGLDALIASLGELMVRASEMRPLAEECRTIMIADNTERSLAGVDGNGVELFPLKTETLLTRGGGGPPLVPKGAGSRLVSDYTVDINVLSPFEITVVGTWPSMDQFLHYHVTGYTSRGGNYVPARNPAGITPSGQDRIADAFAAFVQTVLAPFGSP